MTTGGCSKFFRRFQHPLHPDAMDLLSFDINFLFVLIYVCTFIFILFFSIPAYAFEAAANEIGNYFPLESKQTYYIPYRKGSIIKKKINPSGKLWFRYTNVKKVYHNVTSKRSINGMFIYYSLT